MSVSRALALPLIVLLSVACLPDPFSYNMILFFANHIFYSTSSRRRRDLSPRPIVVHEISPQLLLDRFPRLPGSPDSSVTVPFIELE